MTSQTHRSRSRRVWLPRLTRRRASAGLVVGASVGALALVATFAIAPQPIPTAATELASYISAHPQSLHVSTTVAPANAARDGYSSSPGATALKTSGTNYDWAALVMLSGGWPRSSNNITVMVRWMRQENGTDSWWNRNNPMNNGYGSGGGGGLGSYSDLVVAAQKAAENLQRNPSFKTIVAAFAVSAPTNITEQAIWASPWASSHYGNGSRWHTTPVPTVTAPASAW